MTTTPDSPTADFARGSARILPLLLHWSLNLGGWSVSRQTVRTLTLKIEL